MQYWMCAATGKQNMKWGAQILNGGPGTTGLPLATALMLWRATCGLRVCS